MPELPEVETTRRGLLRLMRGATIESVELLRPDLRFPITPGIEEMVAGRRVTDIRRLGKYLLIDLKGGVTMLSHLGMSGSFRGEEQMPDELKKHDHVVFHLDRGIVIYHDPRRFGMLFSGPTNEIEAHPLLASLGPDPLDAEAFTATYLATVLKKSASPVKVALMDQQHIPGMGNIYASEALFRSHIRPTRKASAIKKVEIARLVEAIPTVLQEAITSGGSTIRSFSGTEGIGGYFQHRFHVYGRDGKPCSACGSPIKRVTQAGRATFFCSKCQH